MIRDVDIAWLAGVFDGEGCVFVQRSRRSGNRVVYSLQLNLANTSTALIERYISILRGIGVHSVTAVETKYGTRMICYVKVARKRDALVLAKIILPHTTAKHSELQMAIWYLERSTKSRQHVATEQDILVLETIRSVKHGGGIPNSIGELTRQN